MKNTNRQRIKERAKAKGSGCEIRPAETGMNNEQVSKLNVSCKQSTGSIIFFSAYANRAFYAGRSAIDLQGKRQQNRQACDP
jgi:hypothetical protein